MRVVSGTLRSRKIMAVDGMETRPTADKIKEAVFSRIGPYFSGGMMLDGYSGSGNIAIEAISRGMNQALVCDVSKQAILTIQKNIKELKIDEQVSVYHGKIEKLLEECIAKQVKFDLIYFDPPYLFQKNEELMKLINEHDLLDEEGHLILESRKEDTFSDRIGRIIKTKEVVYGSIKITYYRKEEVV